MTTETEKLFPERCAIYGHLLNEVKDNGYWSGKGPIEVGMYLNTPDDIEAQVVKKMGNTYAVVYSDVDGKTRLKFQKNDLKQCPHR
tara:strand:+ start:271 stop:528 length:258 start_codon:yes stop_codon:yes gene_type:complete